MDDSEWIKLTANIGEGVLVSVVRAMIKGEAGVGKSMKSNLNGLADEGASLNAPKGKKKYYWPW